MHRLMEPKPVRRQCLSTLRLRPLPVIQDLFHLVLQWRLVLIPGMEVVLIGHHLISLAPHVVKYWMHTIIQIPTNIHKMSLILVKRLNLEDYNVFICGFFVSLQESNAVI